MTVKVKVNPLNPNSPEKISIERDLSRKEKEENLIKKKAHAVFGIFWGYGIFLAVL